MNKKMKIKFNLPVTEVFFDEDFIDFLDRVKTFKDGDFVNFKGFGFNVYGLDQEKSLLWDVPAFIDELPARFIFSVPLYGKNKEEISSLDRGLAYVVHKSFEAGKLYSISGKYDIENNTLFVDEIKKVKFKKQKNH